MSCIVTWPGAFSVVKIFHKIALLHLCDILKEEAWNHATVADFFIKVLIRITYLFYLQTRLTVLCRILICECCKDKITVVQAVSFYGHYDGSKIRVRVRVNDGSEIYPIKYLFSKWLFKMCKHTNEITKLCPK